VSDAPLGAEARLLAIVRRMTPAEQALFVRAGEMLVAGVHPRIVDRWFRVAISRPPGRGPSLTGSATVH
jgi:hypothetical protein